MTHLTPSPGGARICCGCAVSIVRELFLRTDHAVYFVIPMGGSQHTAV